MLIKKGGEDLRLETDQNGPVDIDDWYAHLPAFCNHFSRACAVFRNINIFKRYAVLLKEIFCVYAVGAGGCGVNDNFVFSGIHIDRVMGKGLYV